jgi:hypothetical protein
VLRDDCAVLLQSFFQSRRARGMAQGI